MVVCDRACVESAWQAFVLTITEDDEDNNEDADGFVKAAAVSDIQYAIGILMVPIDYLPIRLHAQPFTSPCLNVVSFIRHT